MDERGMSSEGRVGRSLPSSEEAERALLGAMILDSDRIPEVAEVLGLQKSAASNRYVRALKRLREMLTLMPGFRDELS